jgi:hypothetical protein
MSVNKHDERVGDGVPLLDGVFDHEALHPDVLVLADAMSAVVRLRFRGSIPAVRNKINEGGTERVGSDTSGPCYRRLRLVDDIRKRVYTLDNTVGRDEVQPNGMVSFGRQCQDGHNYPTLPHFVLFNALAPSLVYTTKNRPNKDNLRPTRSLEYSQNTVARSAIHLPVKP